jgi:sporulation protein YlmC with PRC-barrel domain
MAAQFVLGTRATCSDGFCGTVRRMILDPDTRTVTHLVIGPRHASADGRLVPLALAEAMTGEVSLRCTRAEFDRLDPAQEITVVGTVGHDGGYDASEAVQGYGDVSALWVGGSVSGMGIGMSQPVAIISDTVPPGETDLARHDRVHAKDGEIGQIEGFVVDRGDHKVTHLLLKEGHLWGRKEVAIPVSAVASMENGIQLNMTKREIEGLPALDRR